VAIQLRTGSDHAIRAICSCVEMKGRHHLDRQHRQALAVYVLIKLHLAAISDICFQNRELAPFQVKKFNGRVRMAVASASRACGLLLNV
jgi:hypothetical protein